MVVDGQGSLLQELYALYGEQWTHKRVASKDNSQPNKQQVTSGTTEHTEPVYVRMRMKEEN